MNEPIADPHAAPASTPVDFSTTRIARVLGLTLLAIALVSGLSALSVRYWQGSAPRRTAELCGRNLNMILDAKDRFFTDHPDLKGDYPVTWEELCRPGVEGYLQEIPREPMGGFYHLNLLSEEPLCAKYGYAEHERPKVKGRDYDE